MSDPGNNTSSTKGSRVAQVIEEYGLDRLGTELEDRWTTEDSADR